MNKVLLIIYRYTPSLGPRFYRWYALIKQLQKHGIHIEIVDSLGPVHEPRNLPVEPRPSNTLFIRSITPIARRLIFPEKETRFLPKLLYNAQRVIRDFDPQCLIATGLPVTPLLAGAVLKKRNPHLKLILEYGDPYYFHSNFRNSKRLLKALDAPLDRFIMQQASHISVHTETFQQKLIEWSIPSKKIVLTKQFFDMESDQQPVDVFQQNTINLFYAGAFYKNIRNPQPFLEAFTKTKNVNLRFFIAGKLEDCRELIDDYRTRDSRITYLGLLDRSKVLNMLRHADYVVNFCNTGALQLPSKLQELTVLNPRILNLYEHENQKLNQPSVHNIPHTCDAVFDQLMNLSKPSVSDNSDTSSWELYQDFMHEQTQLFLNLIQ